MVLRAFSANEGEGRGGEAAGGGGHVSEIRCACCRGGKLAVYVDRVCEGSFFDTRVRAADGRGEENAEAKV